MISGSADADEPGATLTGTTLSVGEVVRFRTRENARWQEAKVERRERDGSIGVRDVRGGARALPVDRLEVKAVGPRGSRGWEPLADRITRGEQLDIFDLS